MITIANMYFTCIHKTIIVIVIKITSNLVNYVYYVLSS